MGWKSSLFSLVAHGGAIAMVGVAIHEEQRQATSIRVRTVESPPPPPKVEPPPAKAPPPERPKTRAAVRTEPQPTQVDRILDLGLLITGDAPMGVGIAVSVSPATAAPKAVAKEIAGASSDGRRAIEGACRERATKPHPIEKVRIEYPIAAREAGLEGRLVLRVQVGADGAVQDVEVLESVSAKIDREAIDVVKRWRFLPALACGKGVASVYMIARRFELGD